MGDTGSAHTDLRKCTSSPEKAARYSGENVRTTWAYISTISIVILILMARLLGTFPQEIRYGLRPYFLVKPFKHEFLMLIRHVSPTMFSVNGFCASGVPSAPGPSPMIRYPY
jgi:hypothetical protein